MKSRHLPLVAVMLLAVTPKAHADVYKCVGGDGLVSFQDHPCEGEASGEVVDPGPSDADAGDVEFSVVDVPIPGVGEAVVVKFDHLDAVVREDGDRATTVAIRSKPNGEALAILLTFVPNLEGRASSEAEISEVVAKMAMPHLAESVEQEIRLYGFDTTIGPAVFASLTDRKYTGDVIPAGEYSTITVGQVSHSDVIAAFTVLTNGTEGAAFQDAINILASFQVAATEAN